MTALPVACRFLRVPSNPLKTLKTCRLPCRLLAGSRGPSQAIENIALAGCCRLSCVEPPDPYSAYGRALGRGLRLRRTFLHRQLTKEERTEPSCHIT
jgi:hypothetical protein